MSKHEHPLERVGAICFKVAPMQEFLQEFKRLIDAGDLSMICHGLSRSGKSTVLAYLVRLAAEKNSAVVFNAIASGTDSHSKTYTRLARELTESRGGKSPFSHFSDAEALVKRAEADAHNLAVNRVIFLIDEAQELTDEQLIGLKELMQNLINKGLSPFVLLFAQPEILDRQAQLMRNGRMSLVDRFFLRKHRLKGLALEDFPHVLEFYDTTRWPATTGPTYTEYFLPESWARGLRMKDLSSAFQDSFEKIAQKFVREKGDIPIKYLIFAANSVLLNARENARKSMDIKSNIDSAVRSSGIVESFKMFEEKEMLDSKTEKAKRRREGAQ